MTATPSLRLIYFRLQALAEAPQMMMHYAGVSYAYEMAWDYFGKPWAEVKPDIAFNQLPGLVVNDTDLIWQSGSIVRYLAPLTNTKPFDPVTSGLCDAIFESTQELFFPMNPTINVWTGEQFQVGKEKALALLPAYLANFERQLKERAGGPFFFGAKPYYCDFAAWHHLTLARHLKADILEPYGAILEMIAAVEGLPRVGDYIAQRPTLVDVGVEPKLMIDGTAHATGMKG